MSILHVNQIDLYYEISGQGQPLLFIHGLGSSGRDWELQVPHFSQHYQVVTVDVRGHGRSDKPLGPYSVPLFAADIAALMRALEVVPAHVVGISMGGMIGFQLAVSEPALLRRLVIVNAGPELVLGSWKVRLGGLQRLLVVHLLGMRKMGELLSRRLFPKPEQEALRQLTVARWSENDKRAYLAAMRALVGWSVADRLSAIQIPTLVVAADQDYTPVSLKEAYVSQMPQAELVVIPDSRHATPIDQPELFNRTLATFLAQHA